MISCWGNRINLFFTVGIPDWFIIFVMGYGFHFLILEGNTGFVFLHVERFYFPTRNGICFSSSFRVSILYLNQGFWFTIKNRKSPQLRGQKGEIIKGRLIIMGKEITLTYIIAESNEFYDYFISFFWFFLMHVPKFYNNCYEQIRLSSNLQRFVFVHL